MQPDMMSGSDSDTAATAMSVTMLACKLVSAAVIEHEQ